MNDQNIPLKDTLVQLKSAIEAGDWEKAELLDRLIQHELKEAIAKLNPGEDNTGLIDMLTKTQRLYSQLITSSEQARSKFAGELKKISSESKAANLYLKSSQYR